jgi:asparagine synthase (glutamine-hydrolysing)
MAAMPESGGLPSHGEGLFAVLPDRDGALAVASLLAPQPGSAPASQPGAGAEPGTAGSRALGWRTVCHASGRPWLVGRWRDGELTVGEAGGTKIAIFGTCPVTATELAGEAAGLRDLARLDGLARRLPGSFHLAAVADGRCRVQGSASGLRLVFHADVAGVCVASDRSDLLAALAGAEIDDRALAVRLLFPVPHPLLDRPLWHGVHAVLPGSALVVEPDGRTTRTSAWWRPPQPSRRIDEAAPGARDALTAAVDARTAAGGVVSCDLSGGLDSTSVCFLAARGPAKVVASTWPGIDPADDDLPWARLAASHLHGVEHVVWSSERTSLVYERLLEIDDPQDEPTIGVMDRARLLDDLAGLAAMGSRVRLTGIGGDHVAWCSEAHYHSVLRRRPLFAIRQLRGFRALFHWSLRGTIAALADSRPYHRWLAGAAEQLTAPPPPAVADTLGWGGPPRLPPWVTPLARELAADAIREAAATARPLGRTRGEHVDLHEIRATCRIIRQWEQMSARAGLPIESPFLDDRVIEAFLSVRPDDRVTPWRYKPMLVAAMRGIVPDECLARTSKATAALDAAAGLREHRGDLLALWSDSRLAERGLVDREQLMDMALRPAAPQLRTGILYPAIGCEVWLRALAVNPILERSQRRDTAISR